MSDYAKLLYDINQYSKPSWTPTRTQMRDPAELAKQYGITYDLATIQGKFDDVTRTQMEAQRRQQGVSENKYYNDMYGTQQTALDTIRRSNAEAVATGASRGMQSANELSSILGLQQESVAGATQLASERTALADKEMQAYTQNALQAMQTANQAGMGLANVNSQLYAADTQFDVGQMDYYARLDTALKQLMGMQEQSQATRYNADQNLAGQKYAADQQYAAAMAAAASAGGGYGGGGSGGGTTGVPTIDAELDRMLKSGKKEAYIATLTANGMTYADAAKMWNNAVGANTQGPPAPTKQPTYNYNSGSSSKWQGAPKPGQTGMDYYYSKTKY